MKIKKTAALLALPLLMAGSMAGAESPSASSTAEPWQPMSALAPVFPGVGPVMNGGSAPASMEDSVKKSGIVPSSEMNDLFLNHLTMPKNMHYAPLAEGNSVFARHMGTMTVKGKGHTAGALVGGATFRGKESDDFFGGMFLPQGHTREAGGRMLAFNMGLLKLESVMNEVFLQAVDEVRRDTGSSLPYDFLTVDMVHVEQLHTVKTHPKTYSFSIRPVFSADGWMVPLFIRGFASQVDGTYRFLFLAAPDSERDIISEAGLKLINLPSDGDGQAV